MWKLAKSLFGAGGKGNEPKRQGFADGQARAFRLRSGRRVEADDVFRAWTSGDLDEMLAVLDQPTHPVDRHYLLLGIVTETYRRRREPGMADKCLEVAQMHLDEMNELMPAVIRECTMVPRVPTYQYCATVLAERGQYDEAVRVCEMALARGQEDGTKSGFEGRIERIRKTQAKTASS